MTIRQLTQQEDPHFWDALELYVESFPRDEREPLARVAEVAQGKHPNVQFWIAASEHRLEGVAYVQESSRVALLIYIAARSKGKGVGSMLLAHAKARYADKEALFIECERVELAQSQEERAIREARIRFFERHGVQRVATNYVQPALSEDRNEVPLTLFGIVRNTTTLRNNIQELFENIYQLPANSDLEQRTLASVVL